VNVYSFADARRARGLPALAGPGRLDAETAAELRHWRYYVSRLRLRDAAALAGVPEKAWGTAEWGGALHADVLARILEAWRRARSGDVSPAIGRGGPAAPSV
jgi:hypothetical protein